MNGATSSVDPEALIHNTVDGRNPAPVDRYIYSIISMDLYIPGGCLAFLNHQRYCTIPIHVASLFFQWMRATTLKTTDAQTTSFRGFFFHFTDAAEPRLKPPVISDPFGTSGLTSRGSNFTLQWTNISRFQGTVEDDFLFPQVGYVNSLEGMCIDDIDLIWYPTAGRWKGML